MSLLEAVTNVGRECGYQVDSEVIDSTETTTRQLLAIANRIVQEMGDKYEWPKLWKSGSITLVADTATYALPGDFSHYHSDTFWNQTARFQTYGPMASDEYAYLKGVGFTGLPNDRFLIRGITTAEMLIYPTPDSGVANQVIAFEYTSARYVRPQTWAQGTTVAIGDYSSYNGNYYISTTAGANGATPPTHTTGSASDGTNSWTYYSGAYRTFLADTDEPVLSQRVLEQGMLERFGYMKGVTVPALFDSQVDTEYSKARPGRSFSVVNTRGDKRAYGWNGRVTFGRM